MIIASTQQNEPITKYVLHSLYTEVMVLADEARAYFERKQNNGAIAPELAISFSCESLKVTTRLMHSIAWLLSEKAILSGEISFDKLPDHNRELGHAPESDPHCVQLLPAHAQYLVSESEAIYARLKRISAQILSENEQSKPQQHQLMERLQTAF